MDRLDANENTGTDAGMRRLLSDVERMPAADPAASERAFHAVRVAWQEGLARSRESTVISRSRARRLATWAAGLAVLAMGAGLVWRTQQPGTAPVLAQAERVNGVLTVRRSGERVAAAHSLTVAGGLRHGEIVAAAAGASALLRFGPALTVRVAPSTRLRLVAAGEIALEEGTLYVDSDERQANAKSLRIVTRLGNVEHVGTRYLATLHDDSMDVVVRDGRVRIGSPQEGRAVVPREFVEAIGGESLHISAAGSAPERRTVPAFGAPWDWLDAVPAPFTLDRATLSQFLDWYSRETGQAVVFTDGAAGAVRARAAILRGSIAGLTTRAALDVVAASVDLTIQRDPSGSQVLLGFSR